MNREAVGVILIILGWLGVILLMFIKGDAPMWNILFTIIAFGGAWLMLSPRKDQ